MRTITSAAVITSCVVALACANETRRPSLDEANRGIDSLNARISDAYRTKDPANYEALFTDSAVFEWPAIPSVRGRQALGRMARENWEPLRNMGLKLNVAARRIAGDHATEFGAFEQSYEADTGARKTEFGRYVVALVRQKNGEWLMDRFFGFEDSTRAAKR